MFIFGDPADAASLYLDTVMDVPGPRLPDLHYEEMEEQDLRNAMAWLHLAFTKALREGQPESLVEVLDGWYGMTVQALAEGSESFREKFLAGLIFPPGDPNVRARLVEAIKATSES